MASTNVVAIWIGDRFVMLNPDQEWTPELVALAHEWAKAQPGYMSLDEWKRRSSAAESDMGG